MTSTAATAIAGLLFLLAAVNVSALRFKAPHASLTPAELQALERAEALGKDAGQMLREEAAQWRLESDPVSRGGVGAFLEASLLAGGVGTTSTLATSRRRAAVADEAADEGIDAVVGKGDDMLMGMVLVQDRSGRYSTLPDEQPAWLRKSLQINLHHAVQHGHQAVLRLNTSLEMPEADISRCHGPKNHETVDTCLDRARRVNYNWEKEAMMAKYLEQPGVNYVLMVDVDAVLMQPGVDTMKNMAEELRRTGRELLITDEDWRDRGVGHINGGVLFAKSTEWTRKYFKDLVDSHQKGPKYHGVAPQCGINEQVCLQSSMDPIKPYPGIMDRVLVASGKRFNRGACVFKVCGRQAAVPELKGRSLMDPELEVLHFMGESKGMMLGMLDDEVTKKVDAALRFPRKY